MFLFFSVTWDEYYSEKYFTNMDIKPLDKTTIVQLRFLDSSLVTFVKQFLTWFFWVLSLLNAPLMSWTYANVSPML